MKSVQLILLAITSLVLVAPVFAVSPRAEVRSTIKDEKTENVGSRPGLLKNFNLRGRAAIGTGILSAKSGTTLTVTKDGKTYTVNTDSKTQFRRRFWGKATLDEMSVGDTLNVIGTWTDDAHTTIQARLVRDTSIQKRNGVFFGTVLSVSSSGWVMSTINRGNQTVTVSSTTKFVNRKEVSIAKSDIVVGHKVRVKGLWDKNAKTITEVTQVKDFSLPVKTTPTPTPTVTPTPTP